MSDDCTRGGPGAGAPAGNQDLVPPPPVARDEHGRLLPGARLNPAGRPRGRLDDATIVAAQRLEAAAEEAARAVIEKMHDTRHPWIQLSAAQHVLARAKVGELDRHSSFDTMWLEWTTENELRVIERIVKRAEKRMVEAAHPTIDVTPGRSEDRFDLASLPSPEGAERATEPAPEPEDPDWEEL